MNRRRAGVGVANLLEKSFRRVRTAHHCPGLTASRDARPTGIFMGYGWAKGPCATALKS